MRMKEIKDIAIILTAGVLVYTLTGCQSVAANKIKTSEGIKPATQVVAVKQPEKVPDKVNPVAPLEKKIRDKGVAWIEKNMKESVDKLTEPENAIVEMYKEKENHVVWNPKGKKDIKGKSTYKITFTTENDALLGPVTLYLSTDNMAVLGSDFRD